MASLSACGKTISIGDSPAPASSAPASSAPASSAAPASPSASSPAATSGQGGGNSALQVVDSTAKDAGLNGIGGTVVGAVVREAPPKWVRLSAVTSSSLSSPHLININQAALYRFDNDTAAPSRSTCNDACAVKWPPVTTKEGGNVYLADVNPKEVGAIGHKDGQVQITVGGTWFAVGPTGNKATG